ncbi:MAG: DUF1810 domain-containing protein [Rhizobacter sp.]|nr:DUF1810 domain-containing protein [Rhizobacter sp.]
MTTADPFELQRFVAAQAPVMAAVEAELAAGAKTSHWMWFVFPQLKALGRSATALHYGLASAEEAAAYWGHPVLGPRLKHCTELVLAVRGKTLHQVFGSPDDLKFCSCMTLFEAVARDEAVFAQALERCCGGERDARTLALLGHG